LRKNAGSSFSTLEAFIGEFLDQQYFYFKRGPEKKRLSQIWRKLAKKDFFYRLVSETEGTNGVK
jgi:hypothetical protein